MSILGKIKLLVKNVEIKESDSIKEKLEHIYYNIDTDAIIRDPIKNLIMLNTYTSNMNDLIYDNSAIKSNDLFAVQAKIYFHNVPVKNYIYKLINTDTKFNAKKTHDIQEIINFFLQNV